MFALPTGVMGVLDGKVLLKINRGH